MCRQTVWHTGWNCCGVTAAQLTTFLPCVLVITTLHWRWPKYRPKHVGENLRDKIRHKYLSAFLGYLCIMDVINARNMEYIKIPNIRQKWRKLINMLKAWSCPLIMQPTMAVNTGVHVKFHTWLISTAISNVAVKVTAESAICLRLLHQQWNFPSPRRGGGLDGSLTTSVQNCLWTWRDPIPDFSARSQSSYR